MYLLAEAALLTVLGETAEDMPRILLAVAIDTAAYRQDMEIEDSFSILVEVRGSKTGRERLLQTRLMSFTRNCRLQQFINLTNTLPIKMCF